MAHFQLEGGTGNIALEGGGDLALEGANRLNTNTPIYELGSSYSKNFTVNAGGVNVVAFAVFVWDIAAGLSLGTPTYGGHNMTSCGAAAAVQGPTTGEWRYVQAFYIVAPLTGSNALAVSGTSVTEITGNLVAFSDVDQTTPVRTGTYQTTTVAPGGAGSISLTITSSIYDRSFTAVQVDDTNLATNQTSDGVGTASGSSLLGSDHCKTPAASVTHTWTFTLGLAGAMLGFSIQGA